MNKKKTSVIVEPVLPAYVGYCDYFFTSDAFLRVCNSGESDVTLTLKIQESKLFLPLERTVEVPFQSTVCVPLKGIFSPAFLAENDELQECVFTVQGYENREEIVRAQAAITALPFCFWEGLPGRAERLAFFVQPEQSACSRVLSGAERGYRRRGFSKAFGGYRESRDAVQAFFSDVYGAVRGMETKRLRADNTLPAAVITGGNLREATPLMLAVFCAGCLEYAGLHPVLAVGKTSAAVGVWLYDSCFLDGVSDETETLKKYVSQGVNNLIFFDAEDAFSESATPFFAAVQRFCKRLDAGEYECIVDVRRCRLGGIAPYPVRKESVRGYELYKPRSEPPLPALKRSKTRESPQAKWERELLDFSARNELINFRGKYAVRLAFPDADVLISRLKGDGLRLVFGRQTDENKEQERELLLLEEQGGLLRAAGGETQAREHVARLYKRSREGEEETGASTLYLAYGLLTYGGRQAPVVLIPVQLSRARGSGEYYLFSQDGAYYANATLFEALRREYRIDLRAVEEGGFRAEEMLRLVKKHTAHVQGFSVSDEGHLSLFTFQRYAQWKDWKENFRVYERSPLVQALLHKTRPAAAEGKRECLLPLPYDSSQKEAAELAASGESFVLHGPPGTGKSQTIACIIASAVTAGKTVLFVAEKQAALSVVKKRLNAIGMGEFCLTLHAKEDRTRLAGALRETLALVASDGVDYQVHREEFLRLEREMQAPYEALHKKRGAGFSVYEAICAYERVKDAPALFEGKDAFFDGLNEEKLAYYRSAVSAAAAAQRECARLVASPFENVNVTQENAAGRVRVACEVVLAEVKNLRNYLALFLDFFHQKAGCLTAQKLQSLSALAGELLTRRYDVYFCGSEAGELFAFLTANEKLDRLLNAYFRHFKAFVRVANREDKGAEEEAIKRLERVARHPVKREDGAKYVQLLFDIHDGIAAIEKSPLAKGFFSRGVPTKKREEFLAPLKKLNNTCAQLFEGYGAEEFFRGCGQGADGCILPVLSGLRGAIASFEGAAEEFFCATQAEKENLSGEDLPAYLSEKAAALCDNLDLLPARCAYNRAVRQLQEAGLCLLASASLKELSPEEVIAGYERSVLKGYIDRCIACDPALTAMTAGRWEEEAVRYRYLQGELFSAARRHIRETLISRLPAGASIPACSSAGDIRALIENTDFLSRVAPCVLMSPSMAAQYLPQRCGVYDLVIFDEASQLPTAEAVSLLGRARQAVIAGDPNQLPPCGFFRAEGGTGEEESVLSAALAAGFSKRQLLWHYRSRHESLIAFSNATYYGNRLCTFPPCTLGESRVRLIRCNGAYDRGKSKCNRGEAQALVEETVRRLSEETLRKRSIGIVTFSLAQQEYVAGLLAKKLKERGLEQEAYAREEPLFVKNLENVQGDERDVILFSVGYGRDAEGRMALSFGPLNREGGWKRLNVALSRAREEMLVFSTITASDIDVNRTAAKGVCDLKAFLDYAERGKEALLLPPADGTEREIAARLKEELSAYGYECRCGVGSSAFRVDVAVLNREKNGYLAGILLDGKQAGDTVDRAVLAPAFLERDGWKLIRVNSVDFYRNPKRELRRLKEGLDSLSGAETQRPRRYERAYRAVRGEGGRTASFITDGEHDGEIKERLCAIVSREEPISRAFLKKRCLQTFGIGRGGAQALQKLDALIAACGFFSERVFGCDYFYLRPKAVLFNRFRTEKRNRLRVSQEDFTPFETVALMRGVLEERVFLYLDELTAYAAYVYGVRETEAFSAFVQNCVGYGEQKGVLVRSLSDRISLA